MSPAEIYFGYQWDKGSSNSDKPKNLPPQVVFKKIDDNIPAIQKENNDQTWLKRLRASAGRSLHHVIIERLSTCDIVVFDITKTNSNVWIEVDMDFSEKTSRNEHLKLFLLKEDPELKFKQTQPSDFLGYFLSHYECNKHNEMLFKDRNSFLNSIKSDLSKILNYFKQLEMLQVEETFH